MKIFTPDDTVGKEAIHIERSHRDRMAEEVLNDIYGEPDEYYAWRQGGDTLVIGVRQDDGVVWIWDTKVRRYTYIEE